jgi:tetratricopeptide (TPR) repeat protein
LKGDNDKAIADYNAAIRIDSSLASAFQNRGDAYTRKHEYDKAASDFSEAIRLNSDLPAGDPRRHRSVTALALYGRGYILSRQGQYKKAIEDFRNAAAQASDVDRALTAAAYYKLAWAFATAPADGVRDGVKAVDYATKANELTNWKRWTYIQALAAAYAELGAFEEAARWQTTSMQMLDRSSRQFHEAEARLGLLQKRKPYQDSLIPER